MIDTALLTPKDGLSEFDDINEMMYCIKKNNKAITTPSLDRLKNVCMKKLCITRTRSKSMNTTNGTINPTRGNVLATIILPIK